MTELAIRLTHKYVGTYRHLDQWQTIGSYELLASATSEPRDDDEPDITDPRTTYNVVRVTPEPRFAHRTKTIRRALIDEFTSWGCAHEYDCCGCRSYQARNAVQMDDNRWIVEVNSSRNY